MGVLTSLLRGADASELQELLSRRVLGAMRIGDVAAEMRLLASNRLRPEAFELACRQRDQWLARSRLPIRLQASPQLPSHARIAPEERARWVLALYFHQLCHGQPVLLDLRHDRFAPRPNGWLAWSPTPLFVQSLPLVGTALRDLYTGFYDDRPALFEDALRRLCLTPAREAFLAHLGDDGQRAVHFRLSDLRSTLSEAAEQCRAAGVSLPRGFGAMALYLACLYEHLERLAVPCDVRAAFEHGRQTRLPTNASAEWPERAPARAGRSTG